METTLENKKLRLIQWLSTLDNPNIIDKLLELFQNESDDWWEDIGEDEKKSIAKGLEDAKKGKLRPHSEAKKLYGKWL